MLEIRMEECNMAFADNLKQIRKKKGISQEELAQLLNVSRQAVSKWEQGIGYPEVEKLLILSSQLNVSLDSLMADEIINNNTSQDNHCSGRILISSYDGKSIVNCYKILSSHMFKTKDNEPKYALFGVDGNSFWGEHTTVLGWYDNEENIKKEIQDIMFAMKNGESSYELKYAVKTRRHLWRIKIKE